MLTRPILARANIFKARIFLCAMIKRIPKWLYYLIIFIVLWNAILIPIIRPSTKELLVGFFSLVVYGPLFVWLVHSTVFLIKDGLKSINKIG